MEGTSDEAALKMQISLLKIEVVKLRNMARLRDDNEYLYAFVGAHASIPNYALEALREAYRARSETRVRDRIALLRSEQRRASDRNGKAPAT